MFVYIILTAAIILLGVLFNRKNSRTRWAITFLIVLLANFAAYYFIASKVRNTASKNPEAIARDNFIATVKAENQLIVRAIFTDQGYLAITVKNDGQDKTAMATHYCQLAKSKNFILASVKILDAADTKFGDGYAYGTELAEAVCN